MRLDPIPLLDLINNSNISILHLPGFPTASIGITITGDGIVHEEPPLSLF